MNYIVFYEHHSRCLFWTLSGVAQSRSHYASDACIDRSCIAEWIMKAETVSSTLDTLHTESIKGTNPAFDVFFRPCCEAYPWSGSSLGAGSSSPSLASSGLCCPNKLFIMCLTNCIRAQSVQPSSWVVLPGTGCKNINLSTDFWQIPISKLENVTSQHCSTYI